MIVAPLLNLLSSSLKRGSLRGPSLKNNPGSLKRGSLRGSPLKNNPAYHNE